MRSRTDRLKCKNSIGGELRARSMVGTFRAISILLILLSANPLKAQEVDLDQMGAWYMYFFDYKLKESRFGAQGDIQYRSWDLVGDLDQLFFRGGATYRTKDGQVKFTLGYAHITSGKFGESNTTIGESRLYQEALLPQKIGSRVKLNHRFRYEQRWIDMLDFRTRYRYAIFMNVLFNRTEMKKGTVYLALSNEVFINGEKDIGNGLSVEYFDRNWSYAALGYGISDALRVQVGIMHQTANIINKNQLQFSLHHKL